jgi:outer membrane murein-binding lipoprotein Lpp
MRKILAFRLFIALTGVLMALAVNSQPLLPIAEELQKLADQQLTLEQEKNQIAGQFQVASKACWKKFAVNDCLAEARRQKYQSLSPLEKRTLEINARQRELKETERQLRLSDKASTKGSS